MTRSKLLLAALTATATSAAVVVGRRLFAARKGRSNEPSVTDDAQEHAQSKRDKRVAARHARQQKRHARPEHVN